MTETPENNVPLIDVILVPQFGPPRPLKLPIDLKEFNRVMEMPLEQPLRYDDLDDGCSAWFSDDDDVPESIGLNYLTTLSDKDEFDGWGGVGHKQRYVVDVHGAKKMYRGAFLICGPNVHHGDGVVVPGSIGPISTKKYLKAMGE